LNSINFFECFRTKWEVKWEEHYNAYTKHILENGNGNIPQDLDDKSEKPSVDSDETVGIASAAATATATATTTAADISTTSEKDKPKIKMPDDIATWVKKQRREYKKIRTGRKMHHYTITN